MLINSRTLVLTTLLLGAFNAWGEDIDIYSGIQPEGANPNLMILLDNSAAWDGATSFTCPGFTVPANNAGKAVGFEQCALHTAVDAIRSSPSLVGNINMGLMLFAAGSTNGGKLKLPTTAPYAMPMMDTAGINQFAAVVDNLDRNTDKSNGSAVGASMEEVWAYYSGRTGPSGTSYSANLTSACQRNFVVYIANANNMGKPQDQGSWNAVTQLANAGATSAQQTQINIPLPDNRYQSNWGDEWARFMKQNDLSATFTGLQNITTYTIIVSDGRNPEYVKFLQSMAAFGGGKAFVVNLGDVNALVQALLQIFNEVQGVNSAFSSASLPVSANTQGQHLNQVFIGVFRPDSSALPRWQGNLKQYKLGVNPSSPDQTILVDKNSNDAISHSGTGFISPNAESFWSTKNTAALPDSAGGFWVNNPQGVANGYDVADGEIVEKGGVNQRIRLANQLVDYSAPLSATSRQLYTCTSGCAAGSNLSATPFATSNASITAALLGTSAPAIAISRISRSDATNLAYVTLASAPNPALTNGQTVTISGASNADFNGTFTINVLDATHFSFSLVTALAPPTPAMGTYEAARPATSFSITSLTRSGTTATATTDSPHGYATGTAVSIGGATQSEYNGTYTITVTGTNTFTYTVVETPAAPTSGGSATNGGTFIFGAANVSLSSPSGTTRTVTITNPANGNTPPRSWTIGNNVTISGVVPTAYNGVWKITNLGSACPGGVNNKSFCFSMTTTPTTPATGAISVSTNGMSLPITGITRSTSSCAVSATYVSSGSPVATATATVSGSLAGVSSGTLTNISGTPAVNEGAYVQNNVAITVTGFSTFTYPVTITPGCSETTSGMLATPSGGDRDQLIRWVRGEDNAFDEPSPDGTFSNINIRPSVHGDVLHSRPLVVNYGGTTGVVVFYGTNDGVFRAINGNQVNPAGSSLPAPGNELWGFIPTEFYPRFNRLRNNSPQIKLRSTVAGIIPTPIAKDYFFDGSTGVYQNLSTGKVYLYLTARRGGRLIYAIDVSNPAVPKYLWKHTNTDPGFSELGQTWSQPKVITVAGYSNPLLIFGAGYDPNEDAQPATANNQGRGIFILDAVTGNIVWEAKGGGLSNHCKGTPCLLSSMTYAIPSDVTAVDRDFDGNVDRVYAGDVGGNLWRIDFESVSGQLTPDKWQTTLFAAIGGSEGAADKRKIFYPPSVVPTKNFDAVLVATGDREHPTSSDPAAAIKNRLYMLKDLNPGKDGSKNPDGSNWSAITDNSSTTSFASTPDLFDATYATYDGSVGGFYKNLTNTGEKAVNAPVTVGGNTFFSTNAPLAPDPNTCQANLGEARGYKVNFFTGEGNSYVFPGGGLAPTPVVATVTLDNGETRQVIIGAGGGEVNCSVCANNTANFIGIPRKRTFWYEKQ